MSVSIYQPPPILADEAAREEAVLASGALTAHDDPVLLSICTSICNGMRVPAAVFSVVHGQTQHVIVARGAPIGTYPRKYSFAGHAIAGGEDVFIVDDLAADERFSENPWVNGEVRRVRFYAGALVRDGASHAIAVISATDVSPRRSSAEDRSVMRSAAVDASQRLAVLRQQQAL